MEFLKHSAKQFKGKITTFLAQEQNHEPILVLLAIILNII